MENEDPYRRQAPRSKVKVAMSHGASDRCWSISRERKVPETPKLVGKLPTRRAMIRTRFEVTRSINAETEGVLATNFKVGIGGWCMRYQLPIAGYKAL